MKKYYLYFLFIFTVYDYVSQIRCGILYNLDFYKPYTKEAQSYIDFNKSVKSNTANFYISYPIYKTHLLEWAIGLELKHINHLARKKITSYYNPYSYKQGVEIITEYELIKAELDLRSKSSSIGIKNELSFLLRENAKINNYLGLTCVIYLYENYRSSYFYSFTNERFGSSQEKKILYNDLPRNFFFSCANISIFHRLTFQQSEKFSFATKISLGTNLYSNWDQFKKYAWLGLGLELGFGKKKEKIKASK